MLPVTGVVGDVAGVFVQGVFADVGVKAFILGNGIAQMERNDLLLG